MKQLSNKALIAVLAVVAGGTAAVPGLGATDHKPVHTLASAPKRANIQLSRRHPRPAPRISVAPASGVDAQLALRFDVLDRSRAAQDVMPPAVAGAIGPGAVGRFGANPDLSRKGAARGNAAVFVVPGRDAVCLAIKDGPDGGGAGCAAAADADGGNLLTSVSEQPADGPLHVVVAGLVPDGVATVTLTTRDGDSHQAAVNGNTFLFELSSQVPDAVSWDGPDGPHHQTVPY